MVEEPRERLVEGVGLLEVREMARGRDDRKLGAANAAVQFLGARSRCDRIFGADDDQRRAVDRFEERRRIGSRHQRARGACDCLCRIFEHERSNLLDYVGPRLFGRFAEKHRNHLVRDTGRSLFIKYLEQPLTSRDSLRRIGLRTGVAENQTADVSGRMAKQCERDISAHREAADDGVGNVERIEKIDEVPGVIVDRCGRRVSGDAADQMTARFMQIVLTTCGTGVMLLLFAKPIRKLMSGVQ